MARSERSDVLYRRTRVGAANGCQAKIDYATLFQIATVASDWQSSIASACDAVVSRDRGVSRVSESVLVAAMHPMIGSHRVRVGRFSRAMIGRVSGQPRSLRVAVSCGRSAREPVRIAAMQRVIGDHHVPRGTRWSRGFTTRVVSGSRELSGWRSPAVVQRESRSACRHAAGDWRSSRPAWDAVGGLAAWRHALSAGSRDFSG